MSGGPMDFVSLGGLASIGAGLLLHLLSLDRSKEAKRIEKATHVERLDDLGALQHLLPLLVSVRGVVSSRSPKQVDLAESYQAVLHEVTEDELWRRGETSNAVTVREQSDERPWYLEDGSRRGVRVEGAWAASHLARALKTVQRFTAERASIAAAVFDVVFSSYKQGVRKTERFLPVGTVLTVVGELADDPMAETHLFSGAAAAAASKGADTAVAAAAAAAGGPPPASTSTSSGGGGTLGALLSGRGGAPGPGVGHPHVVRHVIRQPASGPFYITPLTLPQLHSELTASARTLRYLAYAVGGVGVVLVARKAVLAVLAWRRQRGEANEAKRIEEDIRLKAAARGAAAEAADGGAGASSSSSAPQGDRAAGTCVVCLEGRAQMVYTSCGHMCCCERCGARISHCPICRTKSKVIRVFTP